ncbi:MAG: hypothetical protein V4617_11615 [Gemmatimonadota bacterium]
MLVSRALRRVIAPAVALVSGALAVPAASAGAQAANYPSLQLPTASTRDYTAAIASGSGTVALFQWREGAGAGMHLGLDAGVADYSGRDNLQLFIGGSIGKELLRAAGEQPLDLLLTGGVGAGFGGGSTLFRVPVGVSVGHTFDLEQGMSLTPYVHPRLSIDICDDCGRNGDNRSEVSLNFDLGLNFQVNRQFGVRVAGSFSGSDFFGDDSFAVGFNWRPAGMR